MVSRSAGRRYFHDCARHSRGLSSVDYSCLQRYRSKPYMISLLHSKFAYGLTLVLVAQAVLFYTASHGENTPLPAPLTAFPASVQSWRTLQEGTIDQDTRDILKADDLMSRVYGGSEGSAELFIA